MQCLIFSTTIEQSLDIANSYVYVCGSKSRDGHMEWMGSCRKQLFMLDFTTFLFM